MKRTASALGAALRDELLRQTYEELRRRQRERIIFSKELMDWHIFPAHVMDKLVSENRENLEKRPDPLVDAVRPLPESFDRLRRLAKEFDPVKTDLSIALWGPSLAELYDAFLYSYKFVTFDELLGELEATVSHAVRVLLKERATNEDIVYFLALPNSRVDKSSIWFDSWAWLHVAELKELVDFVAPSMAAVRDYMEILREAAGGEKRFQAKVLYIDDMAYSGMQAVDFLGRLRMKPAAATTTTLVFVPLLPYIAQKAMNLFKETEIELAAFSVKFQYFQCNVIATATDYLRAMHKEPYPHDILRNTIALLQEQHKENPKVLFLARLMYMLGRTNFPAIVFEHKLAD